MTQIVELTITVDNVASDVHDTVCGAIAAVVGEVECTEDYFEMEKQTIWYGEQEYPNVADFDEVARKVAASIRQYTGQFHRVDLKVLYLSQCPRDNFSVDAPEALDS